MNPRSKVCAALAAMALSAGALTTGTLVRAQTATALDPAKLTLLAPGKPAPDFSVAKWGGGTLKLSDYKGKVVILDFWATWCGPCQHSMPHIERVAQAVKDQNVAVVGVCVFDKQDEYDKWVPQHLDKLHFAFGYDPAKRWTTDSIANREFGVGGIPCTYVIDAKGNVAGTIVGYGGANDKRLEATLAKVGVVVPVAAAAQTAAGASPLASR